jgi:hypothetical protein
MKLQVLDDLLAPYQGVSCGLLVQQPALLQSRPVRPILVRSWLQVQQLVVLCQQVVSERPLF